MDRRLPDRNESAAQILDGSHLTEEALEVYSLGRMTSEEELEVLEGHLLVCGYCQTKLEKMHEYTRAAVAGAAAAAKNPEQKKRMNLLPVAIAAGLAALFLIPGDLLKNDPATIVELAAVRQDLKATAPVGQKLDLKLDTTGIVAQPLAWELANAAGQILLQGEFDPATKRVKIQALDAGQYWVRVKARGSAEVLREFSLSVR